MKKFQLKNTANSTIVGSIPRAPFGARLCFKTGMRAKQFGKRFTRLYNEIFTFQQL